MPSFCRHNRFVENCRICSVKQEKPQPEPAARAASGTRARSTSSSSSRRSSGALKVRKMTQAASDGYENELIPGVKATADAQRLAAELAFAAARLAELATDPPGAYADILLADDPEEARWLAFEIAYLGPLTGDPAAAFDAVRAAHVPWATGELPALDGAQLGPRAAHDAGRGTQTIEAYRAWVARAGSQEAALDGDPSWTPERRFDRIFERLAFPGFGRGSRYELLLTLGRLGVLDVRPTSLHLGGADEVTVAAKRVFGIGDTILLERRSADLVEELDLPIETLDLALLNWGRHPKPRATQGSAGEAEGEHADALARALRA